MILPACGKRLKAAWPHLVESMKCHGHLNLDPEVRERLLTAFFAPTRPATVPPVGPALASPSPANWWKPTGGPSGLKVYPEREVVSVSTCLLPGERRQTALVCLVPALLRKHKSRIP